MLPPSRPVIQADVADLRESLEALPPSRERSLALTKLDEAEMWADRAPREPKAER